MAEDKKILEQRLIEYKSGRKREVIRYVIISFLSVAVFLLVWQCLVQFKLVNVRNLPSPLAVLDTLVYKINSKNPDGNTLITNIAASLQIALGGFALATVIGVPLGLLMGWFMPIDMFVRPIFELFRPVPPIAWIPVIVVFFGVGLQAKAMIIFLSVFVPCVINSYTGIKLTNKTLINVAKTFGASSFETFIKVGVPSAMPLVFTGLRAALSGAWSTLVAAEMLAAKAGLGNMLQIGRNLGRSDIVVCGMAVISVLGAFMGILLNWLEGKILIWKIGA
ncbi:MAG: ABC transporter permease [Synergistaceae bacterium]|nr:ABC transporter permease [Synergistaceae bacterium]